MGFMELIRATGDTKAGTFIAKDRYGNSYYENLADELPCQSEPICCRGRN